MSWSFSAIGKPKNVAAALDAESEKQTGECKVKFDDAKLHLQGLLAQVFSENEDNTPVVKLTASGSGYAKDGNQVQRNCSVLLETFYTKLVCLFLAITLSLHATTVQAKPAVIGKAVAQRDFTGVVVRVKDGDTVVVKRSDNATVAVRIHVGDSPEIAHNANEVDQPFGKDAADYATKLLLNKTASVHGVGLSYGRIVGDVTVDGHDVATDMIARGLMEVYPQSSPRPSQALKDAEATAKKNKVGLWSQVAPIDPWVWRKMTRDQQIQSRGK
jgi:micrococcal nuclease